MEPNELLEKVTREVLAVLAEKGYLRKDGGKAGEAPCCSSCASLKDMTKEDFKAAGADRVQVCHPSAPRDAIADRIDHTLLKPEATEEEIRRLCEEARTFCFASVCVNPCHVSLAARLLRGSGVKVCAVAGFPLGASTSAAKAFEAREAAANGADEIDMVINVGALKSGKDPAVLEDIRAVRGAARGKILKVIIETSLLTGEEKVRASRLAKEGGADFVKTSTGFAGGGATLEDVRLIRQAVGPKLGIKASGGIKDYQAASGLIEAGATRIGASASVAIASNIRHGGANA